MPNFGDVLLSLRKEKGLTQQELADILTRTGDTKITRSAVGMWEGGKRIPKTEVLEAIADFFNVDMEYLLGRSDRNMWLQFFAEKSGTMSALSDRQRRFINILDRYPPETQDALIDRLEGIMLLLQSQDQKQGKAD